MGNTHRINVLERRVSELERRTGLLERFRDTAARVYGKFMGKSDF